MIKDDPSSTRMKKEESSLFQIIFEKAAIGITLVDMNLKFIKINPAYEKLSGYKSSELSGKTWLEITHPDHVEPNLSLFKKMVEGKIDKFQVEKKQICKDGHEIWIHLSVSLVKDADGFPLYTIGMEEDITKRKEAEEKVLSQTVQLRKLNQHQEEIRENERAIIAHEIHDGLGQSLIGLKYDVFWIKKRVTDNPEIVSKLQTISEEIDSIIDNIRNISSEIRPQVLDHLELVEAIEWQLSEFENKTGIRCYINNLENQITFPKKIAINIFRIVQEVLTNIARHSSANEVHILIEKEDNSFRMTIADNGVGITNSQRDDPNSFGIFGIKERVKQCNGFVVIHGKKQEGTQISITIPYIERQEND